MMSRIMKSYLSIAIDLVVVRVANSYLVSGAVSLVPHRSKLEDHASKPKIKPEEI